MIFYNSFKEIFSKPFDHPAYEILIILILNLVFINNKTFAQRNVLIRGVVAEYSGVPIPKASIVLMRNTDTITVISDEKGKFQLDCAANNKYHFFISHIAYLKQHLNVNSPNNQATVLLLDTIFLKMNPIQLEEVQVDPNIWTFGDTTEFSTKQIALKKGALVEDLVRNLKGMHLDRDGTLTFNGIPINSLRINGVDFFGGDVSLALKNLPADLINKLQIIDDYGSLYRMSGLKSGNGNKIINLLIDEDRNKGLFGLLSGRYGLKDRYLAQFGIQKFKGAKQLALYGGVNNLNVQNMKYEPNYDNMLSIGDGHNKSIGFLYTDKWNEKWDGGISYRTDDVERTIKTNSFELQGFTNDQKILATKARSHNSQSRQHNLDPIKWHFKPSAKAEIEFTPVFSHAKVKESLVVESTQQYYNGKELDRVQYLNEISSISGTNWNAGINSLANFKLAKEGRNINIALGFNRQINDNDQQIDNSIYWATSDKQSDGLLKINHGITDANKASQANLRIQYTEPISKNNLVDIILSNTKKSSIATRRVIDLINNHVLVDSLGYYFNYHVNDRSLGLIFRQRSRNTIFEYNVGLNFQHSDMEGALSNLFFLPNLRLQWMLSTDKKVLFIYDPKVTLPSYYQLNTTVDYSTTGLIKKGNPNLKATTTHISRVDYVNNFPQKGIFSNASIVFNYFQNQIVQNMDQIKDNTGSIIQYIEQRNAKGNYLVSTSYNYTRDRKIVNIDFMKNFSLNSSITFNRTKYFENSELKDGSNLRISTSFRFVMTPNKNIYLSPLFDYSITRAENYNSNTFQNYILGLTGTIELFSGVKLTNYLKSNMARGFQHSISHNALILDVGIEKSILKNTLKFKLDGYDLFDDQNNLKRTITNAGYIDQSDNSLGRYVMMSISLRFGQFF